MTIDLDLWYLFPVAILIATVAMGTGIGGAVFFSPLFMLVLKLETSVAVGTALATELFGFASGLLAYVRAKLIDFKLGLNLLMYSVPFGILGGVYGHHVPSEILKAVFGMGLMFIGYQLYAAWRKEERAKAEAEHRAEFTEHERELTDRMGNVYAYTVCNKGMGRLFAAMGGAFVGMISVGLAELQEYHLVARCKVPTPVAVATSIFVVVITVLVASVGHFVAFAKAGPEVLGQVLGVAVYTIPGVIIGGQIGPRVQKYLPADAMKVAIAVLFILVGAFTLYTLIGK